METLLLEIGTEEIPAGYIKPALNALSAILLQKFKEERIVHGETSTFGTPRRLSVMVAGVSTRQAPLTIEVTGPPEKAGFDGAGQPTVAGRKFAEKMGIPVESIRIKQTEKGSYLCAVKTDPGLESKAVFKKMLPQVIEAIPFPKVMRWADLDVKFARPIHSILALFGRQVISFDLGNIKSGRYSFGHRFLHAGKISISHPGEYVEKLRSARVLVDIDERQKDILNNITQIALKLEGKVLQDDELLNVVTNLVEYPAPVAGRFDKGYLEVPDEILINSMREHQKYFAVTDAKGHLLPCFIAVNNTRAKNMQLVAKGHERVLRARLEDARFFYRSDIKFSPDTWVEKLKGVLFQAKLGSMFEKTERVEKIAGYLADEISGDPEIKKQALRAARLCKADLVSHVVIEFPKLQGVMGRIYAMNAGEARNVALAVEEHYRPTYSGGALPETMVGAIVGLSDKIDSICGCFSAGLIPTGASDPYALRRQGIGIIQIMLDKKFSFSLKSLIEKSLSLFDLHNADERKNTADKVYLFLQNRMSHLLTEQGYSKDVVSAVISVSVDHVPDVWNRAGALEKLKAAPDFEPLAVAFKRVVNIIKKSAPENAAGIMPGVDEKLFEKECESALFAAYSDVKNRVSENLKKGDFEQALLDIASLKNPVDHFFEGVLVMADDKDVRNNRLALLGSISGLFALFADFSKI
ncbi:MAG: glycyl-tRNA synthetase beta chain [Thermodesulfobacteriota bacterium]|nr:glycyl-tRNA synthetase beta chain [Thermodesulfobacteriota bacterium]